MPVYIGVDGGGTMTRLLIQQGDAEARFFEFDQTIRFLENGYESAAQRFIELLRELPALDLDDIRSIAIGLAGAGLEEEQRRFEQAIKAHLHGLVTVHVQSDSTLSLGAAFPAGQGMIVIAGTGSVAIGRTDTGSIVRVGGWGRMLGDEGSGYFIGLHALRHYARVIDGRDVPGKLSGAVTKALMTTLRIDEPREVRTALAASKLEPSEFAKLVFDTSEDPASNEILSTAADDLAELIKTCAQLTHYRGDVAAIGSVIQNSEMMRRVDMLIESSGLKLFPLASDAPVKYALALARADQ